MGAVDRSEGYTDGLTAADDGDYCAYGDYVGGPADSFRIRGSDCRYLLADN